MTLPLTRSVDFAFLCDSAAGLAGGKLQAAGIGVDTFTTATFPCDLPLLFVARLSGLERSANLTVSIIDPDGGLLAECRCDCVLVETGDGRPAKSPLLLRILLPVRDRGAHRLDLRIDDRIAHSVPFWVERSLERRSP